MLETDNDIWIVDFKSNRPPPRDPNKIPNVYRNDELAAEMDGKVKIVKMNIDENPNTPTKFGVRGIPTLMVFKGGEVVETKVGGMSKAQLQEWAESAVG